MVEQTRVWFGNNYFELEVLRSKYKLPAFPHLPKSRKHIYRGIPVPSPQERFGDNSNLISLEMARGWGGVGSTYNKPY